MIMVHLESVRGLIVRQLPFIDLYAAIMGLAFGIFIYLLNFFMGKDLRDIGVTIIGASLLYLLLRGQLIEDDGYHRFGFGKIAVSLQASYWLLFTASTLLLYFNNYYRPISYFLIISIMAGIIAIKILHYHEQKSTFLIFSMIIALFIQIRAGIWYNFPTFSGQDVFFHAVLVDHIVQSGYVASFAMAGQYVYTPLSHIYVSSVQIMCQIDIQHAFFVFTIISSFLIFLVYNIGKLIAGTQVGLMAALLLSVTNSVIQYGFVNFTAGVLIFCYFCVIIYIMIKLSFNLQSKKIFITLLFFFTILVIYTHQLSSFAILTIITLIILTQIILLWALYGSTKVHNILWYLVPFYVIAIITQWLYSFAYENLSFFEYVMRPFFRDVQRGGGSFDTEVLLKGTAFQETLWEALLSNISYLLPVFFIICGTYLFIGSRDVRKLQIAIPIIFLYLIVFGFPMLGMRNLLIHRWMPLIYIITVLVSSAYLIYVSNIRGKTNVKFLIIFILVATYAFFMVITPGINQDNPILRSDTTARNQYTHAEVVASSTISNVIKQGSLIRLDPSYRLMNSKGLPISSSEFNIQLTHMSIEYVLEEGSYDQSGSIIVIRNCGFSEPISFSSGRRHIRQSMTMPEDFMKRFEQPHFDLIYSNKEVLAYITK